MYSLPQGWTAVPGNSLAQRLLRRSAGALCVADMELAKMGAAPGWFPPHAQGGPAERGAEEVGGNPPDPWLQAEGGASEPRAPSTRLS